MQKIHTYISYIIHKANDGDENKFSEYCLSSKANRENQVVVTGSQKIYRAQIGLHVALQLILLYSNLSRIVNVRFRFTF